LERSAVRYRLRFHLQEVDLAKDEILIGRGPECHVTIDDPMLSRRHARIELGGAGPVIEDLRSRNGTQLNGAALVGSATLQDGDRIRLGTQELVFVAQSSSKRNFRTTSGLIFCTGCAVPYPSSSFQCPHCGEAAAEDTDASIDRDMPASGWTFHLLSQVVERAIEQGRLADAERMLARGLSELEEQLARGAEVDSAHVTAIAECAARLGCALRTSRWLEHGAKLYTCAKTRPSRDVLALLDTLPADARLTDAVRRLRHAAAGARQAS
jgi:hypothetical protein